MAHPLDWKRFDSDDFRNDLPYDSILHESLVKIQYPRGWLVRDQIKQLLRRDNSRIKSILVHQNDLLGKLFSVEQLGNGLSILWIACLRYFQESVKLLVLLGADVNESVGDKLTILNVLLQMDPCSKNEQLVRLLMESGADLQAPDSMGQSALHFAVDRDRVQLMEVLLEKGVEVNVADNEGWTPLIFALKSRNAGQLLPMLMNRGANALVKDNDGQNALHHLACNTVLGGDVIRRLGQSLIDNEVSLQDASIRLQFQPIHSALFNLPKNELVQLFLDNGANVNALTREGRSPLHMAAGRPIVENIVKTLLERGADVDLRTDDGRTALHIACEGLRSGNIALLLSAGADVLAEDHQGRTPFALIPPRHLIWDNRSVKLMLKELALRKHCQPQIELKDEQIINLHQELQNYYRDCNENLRAMQMTTLIVRCTFLGLLKISHDLIAERMCNPDLEANYKRYDLTRFNMYAEDIDKAFKRAKIHYESTSELIDIMKEVLHNRLPDEIVREVARYSVFSCCESRNYVADLQEEDIMHFPETRHLPFDRWLEVLRVYAVDD